MPTVTPKKALSSSSSSSSTSEDGGAVPPEEGSGRLAALPSAQSLTGQTIERYTLEALIGKGGMGEVYRALDGRLRRKVALKILRSVGAPDSHRPDAVARLFREARAAAALSHPNTVAIHDIGESEGLFYIVMELVNGMPLLAYVGDDRVPLARKLRWLADIGRALVCAHKAGVIHRDVKPSNVMVSEDDVAKVLDFGLAKPIEPKSIDFKTAVGRVVGTLRYMAPEQLAGAEADGRSDQYSFGVTAYELLSGRYPPGQPLSAAPPLDEIVPGFPKDGARVIARTMELAPDKRFGSMNDIVTAIEDVIAGRPVRGSLPVPKEAAVVTKEREKRKSRPSIADTVRDPNTSEGVTETVAPAKAEEIPDDNELPPKGENRTAPLPILAATMPGNAPPPPPPNLEGHQAYAARYEAHARAHEAAARTLMSREKPKELDDLIKAHRRGEAPSITSAPRNKPPAIGPQTLPSPGKKRSGGAEASPVTVPVNPQLQPNAPTPGPTRSPVHTLPLGTSSPPTRMGRGSPPIVADAVDPPPVVPKSSPTSMTIIVIVVGILAIAAFLGTFLGSRSRTGGTSTVAPSLPSSSSSSSSPTPIESTASSEVIPVAPLATTTTIPSPTPKPPSQPSICAKARAERAAGRPNAALDSQCRASGGNPGSATTASPPPSGLSTDLKF